MTAFSLSPLLLECRINSQLLLRRSAHPKVKEINGKEVI
jgi:hypothetical protein